MPKDIEKGTLFYRAIFTEKINHWQQPGGKRTMGFKFKSIKKFLAATVTASIVATAVVPAVSASSIIDYTDVSDRYKEAVSYLVANDISVGITENQFGTDHSIKRADAAVWVVRALGFENINAPDAGFTDVPERAENAVNVLKDLGVIVGKSTTQFGAQDPMTRSEMAKIMALAYELPTEGKAHPFKDVSKTFTDYVQAIYNAGLTEGKSATSYGANDPIKRGEFAIFLLKAEEHNSYVPDVVVTNVTGVVNEDNTVTITGEVVGTEKVKIELPNGDETITIEANVVNGKFSVTTEIPEAGISEITIYDEDNNVWYEGIADEKVSAASLGSAEVNSNNLIVFKTK